LVLWDHWESLFYSAGDWKILIHPCISKFILFSFKEPFFSLHYIFSLKHISLFETEILIGVRNAFSHDFAARSVNYRKFVFISFSCCIILNYWLYIIIHNISNNYNNLMVSSFTTTKYFNLRIIPVSGIFYEL
jgi:hypothetical protein